jgi:hypothetical protein
MTHRQDAYPRFDPEWYRVFVRQLNRLWIAKLAQYQSANLINSQQHVQLSANFNEEEEKLYACSLQSDRSFLDALSQYEQFALVVTGLIRQFHDNTSLGLD